MLAVLCLHSRCSIERPHRLKLEADRQELQKTSLRTLTENVAGSRKASSMLWDIMRLEAGSTVGEWTMVAEVDPSLSASLWVGDNGSLVVYVRAYRVRSLKVMERLEKLAKWASTFEHNCIVPTRELHEVVGGTAVVSNYEEGQPLSAVLARARIARKPVPPPVAACIALDLLDGLHAMGGRLAPAWAHGGLRPETVLVTRGGSARIMDVGISGEMAAVEPLASDKRWAAYAAPEQAEGGRLTEQTDVFTVAAITWEMLVGKPLFEARTPAALKKQIIACDIKRADQVARTAVPKAMALVLEQALEADPVDRFQATTTFANALRAAASEVGEPVDVSQYLEQVQRVALDSRRRSLGQALGRAAPTSMPPPALKKRAGGPGVKFAPPPKIPSFATPPPRPTASKPRLSAKPAAKPAPKPTAKSAAKTAQEEATTAEHESEQRLSVPLELKSQKPAESAAPSPESPSSPRSSQTPTQEQALPSPAPNRVAEGQSSSPRASESGAGSASEAAVEAGSPSEETGQDARTEALPSSHGEDIDVNHSLAGEPPSSRGEDIDVDHSLAGEPPSSRGEDPVTTGPPSSHSEDIDVDHSLAGEPPSSRGEDIDVEHSLAGEPPSSHGEDIDVDHSLAGEPRPTDDPPPAAPDKPVGAAATPPPAEPSKSGPPIDPFADLKLDDDALYNLKPPRRWPWFFLGIVIGAGATLFVVYRAPHLLPLPLPRASMRTGPQATPGPSVSVPPAAPSVEPSAAPEPSVAASVDATDEPLPEPSTGADARRPTDPLPRGVARPRRATPRRTAPTAAPPARPQTDIYN